MPGKWIVFFIVIPLLGAFLAFIEKIWPRRKIAKPAVILVFLFSFILLFLACSDIFHGNKYEVFIGGWTEVVGIALRLDGLSWAGLFTMYIVCFFIILTAFSDRNYDAAFYFFFLILLAGMAGVLLAHDLFNLFVCLEIVGISAYILISYSRKDKAILASFKYLLLSSLGMALFLAGVFIVYKNAGTLCLGTLKECLAGSSGRSREESLAVACIVAGMGIRSAFIPFHTWLPDAHAYAPHPVSAILSGVVIKVTFITLWRLIVLLGMGDVRVLLLWAGVLTALLGVLRALAQTDCKRLLAWHSVSQMGYILAGFGAGNSIAVTGSLYHILSHAIFKSLLFLSIGSVILYTGRRSIKKLSGLLKVMPLTAVLFLAGALSIIGIPPFNGYISKKMILYGLKDLPSAYWVLWAVSAGTAASCIKLSAIFWKKGPPEEALIIPVRNNKGFSLGHLGMIGLALLCLITGIVGPEILKPGSFLISGMTIKDMPFFWNLEALLDTVITAAAGVALFFLIISRRGKKLQDYISRRELSFDWTLVLFLGGFLFFYGFIYLY